MEYKAGFKYNNIEWLVVDAFKFKNEKYLYLVEDLKGKIKTEEDLKKYSQPIKIIFVKYVGNDKYIEITDCELLDKLNFIVTKNFFEKNF